MWPPYHGLIMSSCLFVNKQFYNLTFPNLDEMNEINAIEPDIRFH